MRVKLIVTDICDVCKSEKSKVAYGASIHGDEPYTVPAVYDRYDSSYHKILGYSLCDKCLDKFRPYHDALYGRLHLSVHGYNPGYKLGPEL